MGIEIVVAAVIAALGLGGLAGTRLRSKPPVEEKPAPSYRVPKPPRTTGEHMHEWTSVDVYGWHCSGCEEVWKRPKERAN